MSNDEAQRRAPGLRERGKQKRRAAIKVAAREVFVERGYEAATTREIAERAEVSLGTLFAYAPTKAELLVLIVNDDLDELAEGDLKRWAEDKPLLEHLTEFARRRYEYWAPQPQIGRYALAEITSFMLGRSEPGPEALRFRNRVPELVAGIVQLVARKQAERKIRSTAPPELIADLIWSIYNTEVKFWLERNRPAVESGVERLRNLFSLAMDGFQASAKEWGAIDRPSARSAVSSRDSVTKPKAKKHGGSSGQPRRE